MSLYISLVNALLAIIMMVYNWTINRSTIFLGLHILFLSSYAMVGYIVTFSHSRYLIAISFGHFAPLWYLAPPLFYFYIRSTLEDKVRLRWKDMVHLIPSLISLIGLFPYLVSSFQSKLDFADAILRDINAPKFIQTDWLVPFEYKLILKPLLMVSYSTASLVLIFRANKDYASSALLPKSQWKFIQKWLILISSALIIISAPALLVALFYNANDHIANTMVRNSLYFYLIDFSQLLLLLALILFPQVVYGVPIMNPLVTRNYSATGMDLKVVRDDVQPSNGLTAGKKEVESINTEPFVELGDMILKVMEEKKPFLQVDFSLEDLAEILQVPKHHLYYCFQNVFSKKFTQLRTEYRIDYAKKLIDEADFHIITLDSIGQEAGFASKSSFYRIFKSEVGCSPGEFAKRNRSFLQLTG